MADWTGAAPSSCAELFRAEYTRYAAMNATTIADTLDRAAYFRVRSTSIFSTRDRLLAICHMAAHMIESTPGDGSNPRAGGPTTARSTERGSASFATVPVGVYFGVDAHLLQGTQGGRNLLAMFQTQPDLAGYCT